MNINSMKEMLSIAHKSGDNIHMIGAHGIGKTEIVKQFAKDLGYHCEVLQLTVMDTGDLMGMPDSVVNEHGKKVSTWNIPVWLERIRIANEQGKHCVLFLDELGRASMDIRSASLQIALEKKIQEHSLGQLDGLKTLVVVADNPSDEYDTAEFDAALEDRFMTFNVKADLQSWLEYARSVDILPVVSDFIAEFPERLVYKPETDGEKGSSPRAWEKLSDILKNVTKGSEALYPIITSKVGITVGASFHHYFNNYINIITVENITDAIGTVNIDTKEEQKKAAKKLGKITKKIEIISATELAEKMLKSYLEGKVTAKQVAVYVISLHTEIASGILKTWKESENQDKKDFYFEGFRDATPNHWYLSELMEMANKG